MIMVRSTFLFHPLHVSSFKCEEYYTLASYHQALCVCSQFTYYSAYFIASLRMHCASSSLPYILCKESIIISLVFVATFRGRFYTTYYFILKCYFIFIYLKMLTFFCCKITGNFNSTLLKFHRIMLHYSSQYKIQKLPSKTQNSSIFSIVKFRSDFCEKHYANISTLILAVPK